MKTKTNVLKMIGMGILSILIVGSVAAATNTLLSMQIIAGTVTHGAPTTLSFTNTLTVSSSAQTLEQAFNGSGDYFFVQDLKGADGGYSTTLQASGALTAGTNTIPTANISFKSTTATPTLITGGANTRVVLDSNATTYQNLSSARTFILRSNAPNSGVIGKYGALLSLKIDVPARQPAGTYTTNLVYTLIEN